MDRVPEDRAGYPLYDPDYRVYTIWTLLPAGVLVELEFDESALEAIADQALLRGTGARGLRAIMEEVLLAVMYEVPSKSGIKEVVVNQEVILKHEAPLIVYHKESAESA